MPTKFNSKQSGCARTAASASASRQSDLKFVVEIKPWDLAKLICKEKDQAVKLAKLLAQAQKGDVIKFRDEDSKKELGHLGQWIFIE